LTMADKPRACRRKQEMDGLRVGRATLVQEHRPLTIRHLFYRAVAAYLIAKTEVEYRNVVIRRALKVLEVAEQSERKLFEQIAGTLPKIQ
jgi:hypothetical protein